MGLVGPGFVGAHHIDAVRRLGFVDVVAVAGSTEESARRKADALGVPKAYGSYEALARDPDVHVVHNTTPNYLHAPVIMAALAHRKHVVSDKPLAMTATEARGLLDAATRAGVVHAVTFNYRGNPLVQQARSMIAAGELGPLHFVHGSYLQDWLIEPDRLLVAARTRQGRRELGDWRHRHALVRSRAARHRSSHHRGARRPDDGRRDEAQAAAGDRSLLRSRRQSTRAGRHHQRGPGDGARALRQRREGVRHRRAGLRRPQERLVVRGQRREGVAALVSGAAERAMDRASACAESGAPQGSVAARTRRSPVCASAGRPPGSLERRLPQSDCRRLRVRSSPVGTRLRYADRPSRHSKTDTGRRASWTRSSTAIGEAGSGPLSTRRAEIATT